VNFIRVLMVGLAPESPGYVLILSIEDPKSGGIKDFKLKVKNAFLTGKIPTDYKFLRPKTLMATIYSFESTVSAILM
jgi:hypothetical protein